MRARYRSRLGLVALHQLVLPGRVSNAALFLDHHPVDRNAGGRIESGARNWRRPHCFGAIGANAATHSVWPMRIALAWASLRRHATRTLLATLGVAVAAAMLLD